MPPSLPIPLVFRKPLSNHKNGAIFCIVFRIGGLLCSVLSSPSVGRTVSPQIDRRDRVRPQGPGISFTDAEEEPARRLARVAASRATPVRATLRGGGPCPSAPRLRPVWP